VAITVVIGALASASPGAGAGAGGSSADPARPAGIAWTRSPGGAPGAGNLNGLATDGKTFVAVGLVSNEGPGAPIWTSKDGLRWRQARGPVSAFPAGTIATKVVYDGERFLAFGRPKPSDGNATLAWSSPNGKRWAEYRGTGLDVPSGSYPASVAVTRDGLLLLVVDPDTGYTLFRSKGDQWRSLGAVTLAGGPSAVVAQVLAHGSGLVGAGNLGRDAAAWTSDDGAQWTAATIDGVDPGAFETINDLVALESKLVGVGVADNGVQETAYAWTSTDGAQWTPPGDPTPFLPDEAVSGGIDVATVAGGTVYGAGHDGPRVALWTSGDAKTWERVADDPELQVRTGSFAEATGVAAAKGRVVLVFREQRLDGTSTSLVGLGIVSGASKR
jgi:hypothetical protein